MVSYKNQTNKDSGFARRKAMGSFAKAYSIMHGDAMTKLINIHDLAKCLGTTVPAIYSHIHRQNYAAIPRPIKLGRRLAWSTEVVDNWLREKITDTTTTQDRIALDNPRRGRGRPRKQPKQAR